MLIYFLKVNELNTSRNCSVVIHRGPTRKCSPPSPANAIGARVNFNSCRSHRTNMYFSIMLNVGKITKDSLAPSARRKKTIHTVFPLGKLLRAPTKLLVHVLFLYIYMCVYVLRLISRLDLSVDDVGTQSFTETVRRWHNMSGTQSCTHAHVNHTATCMYIYWYMRIHVRIRVCTRTFMYVNGYYIYM